MDGVLEPLSKIQTTGQLYHRDTESQRKLSFCEFAIPSFFSVTLCLCGKASIFAPVGIAPATRNRLDRAEYHQAEPEIYHHPQIHAKWLVARRWRQISLKQKVNRVSRKHRHQRVDEIGCSL